LFVLSQNQRNPNTLRRRKAKRVKRARRNEVRRKVVKKAAQRTKTMMLIRRTMMTMMTMMIVKEVIPVAVLCQNLTQPLLITSILFHSQTNIFVTFNNVLIVDIFSEKCILDIVIFVLSKK
jgi:hypothetical protein